MISLYFSSLNTYLFTWSILLSPRKRKRERERGGTEGWREETDKQMINLATLNFESKRGKKERKKERKKKGKKKVENNLNINRAGSFPPVKNFFSSKWKKITTTTKKKQIKKKFQHKETKTSKEGNFTNNIYREVSDI